ncbi:hypothetical protein Tco_0590332 [Tanacetum coccineum]
MGGSFQTSPPRSTQAPPEGTTSGGAEDLDKLTALSTLVSTLVPESEEERKDVESPLIKLAKQLATAAAASAVLLVVKSAARRMYKDKSRLVEEMRERGPDVNVDNFAANEWMTMKHVKSFFEINSKLRFDKIRAAVAELKSLNIRGLLKRPGCLQIWNNLVQKKS